jgi:signal transduction histidine kinase
MQRMAALVEDFLVFARPLNLQLAELDARELVSEVLSSLEPEALAAGVALDASMNGPARLKLDASLMKQALFNLVRNAIEASAPKAHVRVSLRCEAGTAQLAVEDEGAGFAPDAPIFEPFYTTKAGGTGLGLAIAHRIVMDHAGTLEAKTRAGRTVFVIKLPIAHARGKASRPLAALHP